MINLGVRDGFDDEAAVLWLAGKFHDPDRRKRFVVIRAIQPWQFEAVHQVLIALLAYGIYYLGMGVMGLGIIVLGVTLIVTVFRDR